jgi:poly(A) polymerase Pap1
MQVNDWWIPKIAMLIDRDATSIRTWLTHDPCFNVGTAKWIFLSALAQSKYYWQSIGIYQNPTRWRQIAYARDVARLLKLIPRVSSATATGPNMPDTGN